MPETRSAFRLISCWTRLILVKGESNNVLFSNIDEALKFPDTQIRLFGKPEVRGQRRMGVALARDSSIEAAKNKAISASNAVTTKL